MHTRSTNDVATSDFQHDLLSANDDGKMHVLNSVKQHIVEKSVLFFNLLKK